MELPCKLRKDWLVFCLELDQELFPISENHVTLGPSACDVCVSSWQVQGCGTQVQAADDFTPSPGAAVPPLGQGRACYLGVPSPSLLFYNTIQTLYGIKKYYGVDRLHYL